MNAAKWVVVGVCILGSVLNILDIGKPRKPLTPGVVVGICTMNAFIAIAVMLS